MRCDRNSFWHSLFDGGGVPPDYIMVNRPDMIYSNRARRLWRKLRIVSFVGETSHLMPQPYSYALPQKVIQAIKLDGLKIMEASQLFNISRSGVGPLGAQRQEQTGDFLALPNQPPGNGHKITDP
jgi:hypothetical protein